MNPEKQIVSSLEHLQNYSGNEEISLVDIFCIVLRRKKLILSIMAITVVIGLVYAYSAPRIYKSDTIILHANPENLQALNIIGYDRTDFPLIKAEDVFEEFNRLSNARSIRKEFFYKEKIIESFGVTNLDGLTDNKVNKLFESFSRNIKVYDKGHRISIEGTNKAKLGLWLDAFVKMVNQKAIDNSIRNIQSKINARIISLEGKIASKRLNYIKLHEYELNRLEAAYKIAKKLQITEFLGGLPLSKQANLVENNMTDTLNLNSLYMRGTKALEAEISVYKQRSLEDSNIASLRAMQEELRVYKAMSIDRANLKAIIVDKKGVEDVYPVSPKRKLILFISIGLGVGLGLFSVLVFEFFTKVRLALHERV